MKGAVSYRLSAFGLLRLQPCFVVCALCSLIGCGAAPRAHTTFLRSVDLVEMTDTMAQSFASDEIIGERTPSDEPWVISMYRVVNHTNQIIPEREKWLYMGRLRAMLAQSDIAKARSIIWIIPPERWPIVAEELNVSDEPYGLRMKPTHLLTAEFHALTNTSGSGRSDAYVCEYQLVDLGTGTLVWDDKWEVKRAVEGRTYD
ncbi:MAG: hypothetical protein L0Y44_01830 [Phycisphaerales bacterium]|nr:hypothetical protein [Phycisphaerales bacterium]MCI0629376.1 hypothetical protein [Phycisphaerales bacterium]MCI0674974.1 hypothetical protein [Phycisphaerales bacterium]